MPITVPGTGLSAGVGSPSGTLVGTVVSAVSVMRRASRVLEDNPFRDRLSADVTDTSTEQISVQNPTFWAPGQIVDFDDGTTELMRISQQTVPLSNPISVERGYNGTTAATHDVLTYCRQNARFTYDTLLQAVTDVCEELWPYVWNVRITNITPSTTTTIFDVPQGLVDVIYVTQESTGTVTTVQRYDHRHTPILLDSGIDSNIASTYRSLKFPAGFYNLTNDVTVFYRSKVSDSTITDDMDRLVEFGVLGSLMAQKELPLSAKHRSPNQSNLAPGSMQRSAQWYESKFIAQRAKVNALLMQTYPPMRRWVG